MTARRATLWVGALAALAYANSLPNGFAYDDTTILAQNEVVTEGRVLEAWERPYWPRHAEESGLYRPVTVSSFAAEWRLFGPNPIGFHAINVVVHTGVSLLVLALLLGWTGVAAATLGAAVFAVHPIHTEAVSNIVGRGELYAAAFALGALWLYDRGRHWTGVVRVGRLLGIGVLYFLAMGAKEVAVTLPGLMLMTDFLRAQKPRASSEEQARATAPSLGGGMVRAWRELPIYGVCVAVLGGYLALRLGVVGALLGELPAPALRGLSSVERIATALSLWPQFMRLLLFPVSLSADYTPALLFPVRSLVSPEALAGVLVIAALVGVLWTTRRSAPLVALGIAWFAVSISPISHFFFSTGVLLAERTLYLPSVGLALAVAGVGAHVVARLPQQTVAARRAVPLLAALAVVLLMARTVERNPSWMSTFTVLDTLANEHPESSLAVRTRATGLVRAGDIEGGAQMYEMAVELSPSDYAILTEVGNFYGEQGAWVDAQRLLLEAIALSPGQPAAYRLQAGQLILQERYRDAHRVALDGLGAAGADRELFALVSETYIAKGDFAAAIRARYAALGQDPESVSDLERLGDLYLMAGDSASADQARLQALKARARASRRIEFTPAGRVVQRAPLNGAGSGR